MKAVILDMYGVILKDSGDSFYSYVNRTFPELTPADIYPVWDRADVGEITSLEVFRQLGFQGDLAQIEREYLDTIEIDEAFYGFADEIKKRFKLALISNDSSEWSRFFREKFILNKYFDVISISGDLKMKKPAPGIFRLTIEKLECTAGECVYIDDRRYNLEAAQALGMNAILFNSRNVPYDGKTVKDFGELADMLTGH